MANKEQTEQEDWLWLRIRETFGQNSPEVQVFENMGNELCDLRGRETLCEKIETMIKKQRDIELRMIQGGRLICQNMMNVDQEGQPE